MPLHARLAMSASAMPPVTRRVLGSARCRSLFEKVLGLESSSPGISSPLAIASKNLERKPRGH